MRQEAEKQQEETRKQFSEEISRSRQKYEDQLVQSRQQLVDLNSKYETVKERYVQTSLREKELQEALVCE